jgi:hypothetical protein
MTGRLTRKSFRAGDRVVRNKAVGSIAGEGGDMAGTIVRTIAVPFGSGGTRARLRVRWDNGYTGTVEDRQVVLELGSIKR